MERMNCIGLTMQNCIVSEKEHRSFENDENFHNNAKYFTFGIILYNIEKQKKAPGFLLNNTYLYRFCKIYVERTVLSMIERKIKMTPAEVADFVNEASKCDFDIDISYHHYVVDAKSILGVMGLDFRSTLTLQYAGHNDEFESYVSGLALA